MMNKFLLILTVISPNNFVRGEKAKEPEMNGATRKILAELSDKIELLEDKCLKAESLTPQSYQCGFQPSWGSYNGSPADGPITYDRLLFVRNDPVYGLPTGLDIQTGVFTSQFSGVYEISWSLIGDQLIL